MIITALSHTDSVVTATFEAGDPTPNPIGVRHKVYAPSLGCADVRAPLISHEPGCDVKSGDIVTVRLWPNQALKLAVGMSIELRVDSCICTTHPIEGECPYNEISGDTVCSCCETCRGHCADEI